jgi:hypothetical protein
MESPELRRLVGSSGTTGHQGLIRELLDLGVPLSAIETQLDFLEAKQAQQAYLRKPSLFQRSRTSIRVLMRQCLGWIGLAS